MAVQYNLKELDNCESYFSWLVKMVRGETGEKGSAASGSEVSGSAELPSELLKLLFDTDFIWFTDEEWDVITDDENRAADAMELRRMYANYIGKKDNRSDRDVDRIWKSIHGKASILEVILSICIRLDELMNQDEESGSMVSRFFSVLIHNLGLDEALDEHSEEYWKSKIDIFLNRKYAKNGAGGGLFVVKKPEKDFQKCPLRAQMNAWVLENMDEEGYFKG